MGLGGRVPSVKGLPDGVRAHLVPRDKAKVDVVAREAPEPGTDPFAVLERILPDPADAGWVLVKDRRSAATLRGRFGDEADQVVLALVAAGAVVARYAFHREQLVVGPLDGWRLQPTWQEYAAGLRVHRAEEKDAETRRAERAAESIAELDPGLARTLRDPSRHRVNLPLLVHAAEDLAAGTTHAHAKDFLQHHFKSTKAHRDPARVLRRAGASDDTLDALGIARLPHIGIAGPITLHGEGESVIRSAGFAGPVRLRVPTTGYPATTTAEALVIVENEAAAEILADEMPEVAVLLHRAFPRRDCSGPGETSPPRRRAWRSLRTPTSAAFASPGGSYDTSTDQFDRRSWIPESWTTTGARGSRVLTGTGCERSPTRATDRGTHWPPPASGAVTWWNRSPRSWRSYAPGSAGPQTDQRPRPRRRSTTPPSLVT